MQDKRTVTNYNNRGGTHGKGAKRIELNKIELNSILTRFAKCFGCYFSNNSFLSVCVRTVMI